MENKYLQIVYWIMAIIGGFVALTAFAFQNFELKIDAEKKSVTVEKRFDKIDDKLDQIYRGMKR